MASLLVSLAGMQIFHQFPQTIPDGVVHGSFRLLSEGRGVVTKRINDFSARVSQALLRSLREPKLTFQHHCELFICLTVLRVYSAHVSRGGRHSWF